MATDIAAAYRLNRRDYLGMMAVGAGLCLPARYLSAFPGDPASAAMRELLVRSENPFNAEPKLERLPETYLTPVENFFVRNHGNQPKIDPKSYKLTIEGAVERPLTLTLAELIEKFSRVNVTAIVTCAGNRRTEFAVEKPVPGVAWDAGAIGNAEWSGVRLSDVLKHCGVKPEAKHVWFEGQDQIMAMGETRTFGGSIPLETAMEGTPGPRAILADRMNGNALTAEHGFPLRTIVPGYIGARSVKWLSKITISDKPSNNFYLAKTYKIVEENTPEKVAAASPIYEYLTNSAICDAKPQPDEGKFMVRGYALPGGTPGNRITEIGLTSDGGKTWQPAKIVSPVRDFGWVLWTAEVALSTGFDQIQVRAIDSAGVTQPVRSPWNAQGYQYNGWYSVSVKKSA